MTGGPTLLELQPSGLYCPMGDFYIDPKQPVANAIITHAHSDHARYGCTRYLCASAGEQLMRMRLGNLSDLRCVQYGEKLTIRGVSISLHPAGHILGSAQIRLEYRGQVVVVTGDYKLGSDPTCESWEPIRCHLMVTESTFGLPVYRWRPSALIIQEINDWWRANRDAGRCSVLFAYAIGKSQRLLAGLDASIGKISTHGAIEKGIAAYRNSGIRLPETTYVGSVTGKQDWSGHMVIAVPSANGTSWMRRFGSMTTAMVSGWMAVRGARRRRAVDRGFALSDHVDWTELLRAVSESQAEHLWVTHGYAAAVARYFQEKGLNAIAIDNRSRTDEEEDATSSIHAEDDS